jgi:hypothetical protein
MFWPRSSMPFSRTRLLPLGFRALLALGALAPAGRPSVARADTVYASGDVVRLRELLPALAGSELGELPVGKAPLPGQSSVVLGSDVRRALKEAGHDARGLAIPRSSRVERKAQTLSESELKARVGDALASSVAPCSIGSMSSFAAITLGDGPYELRADAPPRRNSGRSAFSLTLVQGTDSRRIHGQIELHCPPPAVQPGASVKLTVTSGAVRVSAPATAHQPGQPGDQIRVTSSLNRQSYLARVVDANTVELVR